MSKKKEVQISSCGTVIEIDLSDEVVGRTRVLLGNSEVRRILQATLEVLPPEQQKKIANHVDLIIKALSNYGRELEITILPVTNRKVLKEWNVLRLG